MVFKTLDGLLPFCWLVLCVKLPLSYNSFSIIGRFSIVNLHPEVDDGKMHQHMCISGGFPKFLE